MNLFYMVEVDDDGPVNADEGGGVELAAQLGDGLAQHVGTSLDMEATVVVGGFYPFDGAGGEQDVLCAVSHYEACQIGFAFLCRAEQSL